VSVNGSRLEGLSFPEAVELIKAAGEQGGPRIFIVRQRELPSPTCLQVDKGGEVSSEVSSPLADGQNTMRESPAMATSMSTEANASVDLSSVDCTAALPSARAVADSSSLSVAETTTTAAPELPVPVNVDTRSVSDTTNSTVTYFQYLQCHCYNC